MNRFVVHDELGPIRAFPNKKEAEAYRDQLLRNGFDAHVEVKPKPAKFNPYTQEEAPF